MNDTNDRYPRDIQQLFTPKPPLLFIPSSDYPIESRSTPAITPINQWKSQVQDHIARLKKLEADRPPPQLTKHQLQVKIAKEKLDRLHKSKRRQLDDWNNLELLHKREKEVMKDPYRTVFVSRIDYALTELDLSEKFSKFGVIESIRIIRDLNGKSRGYGFIVFEKQSDAANCVDELCRNGMKVGNRTILVDIERGRIIRNWKPTRLGGGLGGRHYTKPDVRFNKNSSAHASGRRFQVANNPHVSYQPKFNHTPKEPVKPVEKTVKDKYAKYQPIKY
jgi:U1 small nuclear ribonucleoprotein